MSTSPRPSRPNLEYYRKEAKRLLKACKAGDAASLTRLKAHHPHPDRLNASVALADAQGVIARENGFESWPKFVTHVGTAGTAITDDVESSVNDFLLAACEGNQMEAQRALAANPAIIESDISVAAMLGEADVVEAMLKRDPALVTKRVGPKNWYPLLYVSFSRFHLEGRKRAAGIVRVAKLLLAYGADPNGFYPWDQNENVKLPALWAATSEANNPALARVLLEAGANPNDSESVYHCAEKYHVECLDLLHEFGANLSGPFQPWNNTPLYFILGYHRSSGGAANAFKGMRWLLEHGADPNAPSYEQKERPIHLAAANGWGAELLELLLRHGADLGVQRKDGKTAFELAQLRGNTEAVDWLREHGAGVELSEKDEFLAACARGDGKTVRAILKRTPDLCASLTVEERGLIHSAASEGKIDAVRVMLKAGWAVEAPGRDGATPLHWACWFGQANIVRLLLSLGAPVNIKDITYQSTPMGYAVHGSQHCQNPRGDYPAIVNALIAAGAELPEHPYGSDAVRAVLKRAGVG